MNCHIDTIIIDSPISKVTYGLNDRVIDVTNRFNEMIHNGSYLEVTNRFAGQDPLYGIVKKLYITLNNGKQLNITEGKSVMIKIVENSIQVPNINITRLDDENTTEYQNISSSHADLISDLILFVDL